MTALLLAAECAADPEMELRVRCFMDGIDWQYHLDGDVLGTTLFPDEKSLREKYEHLADGHCGVVEVEVRLIRWVEPQNLGDRY